MREAARFERNGVVGLVVGRMQEQMWKVDENGRLKQLNLPAVSADIETTCLARMSKLIEPLELLV